ILVISVYIEPALVEKTLQAGAVGYFSKEEPTDLILHAIDTLSRGKVYISPMVAKRVKTKFDSIDSKPFDLMNRLSHREIQVFKAIGEGTPLKEVAYIFKLSPKTVETHCLKIKAKLHLKDSHELFRFAAFWFWESLLNKSSL